MQIGTNLFPILKNTHNIGTDSHCVCVCGDKIHDQKFPFDPHPMAIWLVVVGWLVNRALSAELTGKFQQFSATSVQGTSESLGTGSLSFLGVGGSAAVVADGGGNECTNFCQPLVVR